MSKNDLITVADENKSPVKRWLVQVLSVGDDGYSWQPRVKQNRKEAIGSRHKCSFLRFFNSNLDKKRGDT